MVTGSLGVWQRVGVGGSVLSDELKVESSRDMRVEKDCKQTVQGSTHFQGVSVWGAVPTDVLIRCFISVLVSLTM